MCALDRSILDAVPAFAALTGKEIDIVLAQARSLRYPKGMARDSDDAWRVRPLKEVFGDFAAPDHPVERLLSNLECAAAGSGRSGLGRGSAAARLRVPLLPLRSGRGLPYYDTACRCPMLPLRSDP